MRSVSKSNAPLTGAERELLSAFRNMDERRQVEFVRIACSLADAFPRRERPYLSLVGASAT